MAVRRILLVSEGPWSSSGLEGLVRGLPGVEVTTLPAGTWEEEPGLPDVVMIDGAGSEAAVVQELREARCRLPGVPVVVLVPDGRARTAELAWRRGASAVLRRELSRQNLQLALRCVLHGLRMADPVVLGADGSPNGADVPVGSETLLSGRQAACLRLLLEGSLIKQIARQLGISEGTVRIHLSRAYEKLGCTTRLEAALEAARRGIA